MRIIKLDPSTAPSNEMLNRVNSFDAGIQSDVAEIIANVRARGNEAVFEYTERFDGVKLKSTRLQDIVIQTALRKVKIGRAHV